MNQQTVLTSGKRRTSFKDWPMAGKLLLLAMGPLGLTLAITLALIFIGLNRLEAETSSETLQQYMSIIRQQFAESESGLLLNASELTANPLLLEAAQRDNRPTLQSLLLSAGIRSGLDFLEVVDAEGQVVVTNRNFELNGTPPELKQLRQLGLLQITDAVELVPTPSGWLMTTVRPIKLQSGEVFGTLAIGRLLNNSFLSTLNFQRTNPILMVFDAAGNLINSSETEAESNLAQTFEVDRGLWAGAANGETLFNQAEVRDELRRVAYAPLVVKKDQTAAVFGLALSTAQTTGLRDQLIVISLGVMGVVSLLTILAVFFLGRSYIIRPITALVSGVEQFAAGHLEVRVQSVSSQDEIGMLAAAFNKMGFELQQTLAKQENRTRGLEIMTNLSERLTAILNVEELMNEVVNQVKEKFGYYHAQIFLLDETGRKLSLASATGEAGQIMLAQKHIIPIGRGLVGRAAQQQQVILAPNLARMIAPELVTAENVADIALRETDPAFCSQWYHNHITRIFGSIDQLAAGSTQATSRLELGLAMFDVGEFAVPLIQGAREAAQDLGVNLEIIALPHTDYPEPLLEEFNRMVTAGKDGLVLMPRFQSFWPPYLNQAAQAGIPVVMTNLTGPDIANWVWFGQDGYQGGFVLGVEFLKSLLAAGLQSGEIVAGISGTAEPEFVARYEGFKAGLGGTAFTCSELFYTDTIEPEADQSLWVDFLSGHPNLIAAVGFTAQAIPTLSRIKTATGGSWLIAGFDLETATLKALETGLAQVTVAQHPYLQGYLPVLALVQHLRQGIPLSNWVEKGWLPNPLLPDTKAELSVPIKLQGQVVGVLDVQADQIASLAESDIDILQSLANQVAIGIRNARQFAQVEAALAQANELQQRYIQQSWERQRISRKNVGRVQFSLGESTTLNETIVATARQQALAHQQPVAVPLNGSDSPNDTDTSNVQSATSQALVAPITLRGIPIGDLQLHESASRRWTDDELALVNAVVDQVAQAAEAIRLLDESQERATREQLIGQITGKMRRATDLENLMEVTVAELARVLEPARTFVHMDLKSQTSAQPQPGNGSPVNPNQPLITPITEGEEA